MNSSACFSLKESIGNVLSQLDTNRLFQIKELKPQVEMWKAQMSALSTYEKKIQADQALTELLNNGLISLNQMSLSLRLITKVLLSKRVTHLACQRIFIRQCVGYDNYPMSINGLERYIRAHHPEIPLVCTSLLFNRFEKGSYFLFNYKAHQDFVASAKRLLFEEKQLLILCQPKDLHLSLLRLSFIGENELDVHVMDSLGLNLKGVKNEFMSRSFTGIEGCITGIIRCIANGISIREVFYFPLNRQYDQVNCSAFVLSDLQNALLLLKMKIPLFEKQGEVYKPHDLFDNLTQSSRAASEGVQLPNKWRPLHANDTKMVNDLALRYATRIVQFFIRDEVEFVEPQGDEDEDSETDEYVGDCTVM